MNPDDPFNALRERAYDMANSGRFKRWDQIAYALRDEGYLSTLITRLDGDRLAVMMITRCCGQTYRRA